MAKEDGQSWGGKGQERERMRERRGGRGDQTVEMNQNTPIRI